MTDRSPARRTIGDDWVFDELLAGPDGRGLDLTDATLVVLYFAPGATIPAGNDLSSGSSITAPATSGMVRVVVPSSLTSSIQSLPAGRKQPLAHIQILTIDANIRTTRRVIVVEPVDPSTLAPVPDDRGDPDYERIRFAMCATSL